MNAYRSKLNDFKTRRNVLTEQLEAEFSKIEDLKNLLDRVQNAQTIIQLVARQTQEQLKFHIESIVTMALESVFSEPYSFQVDFEVKRNQTEALCWFVRNEEKVDPLTATGGGAVDIAAFALRVTLWSLENTRPVLVFDEPFRFVSRDLQRKAGEMMKLLSEKLGIQFIVVTHNKDLVEVADKVFEVSMKEGVSRIEEL